VSTAASFDTKEEAKMRRMFVAGIAAAAFVPAAAGAQGWGNAKVWTKKAIAPVIEQVKDPKVKEALDGLRKAVNDAKGKLKGFYPQFRALTGYLAVAAKKTKEGAKLDDILPFIDKAKEALGKIGEGGRKALKDWIKENAPKFKGAAKIFKTALKKAWGDVKKNVFSWWKKMKKKIKEKVKEAAKEAEKKEEKPAEKKPE
jgi:hypothetical protein